MPSDRAAALRRDADALEAQARAILDEARGRAAPLLREAEVLRGAAAQIEGLGAEIDGLTSTRVESTIPIDTMETRIRSDAAKFKTGSQNSGKARSATPFGRWLEANKTAASVWAAAHRNDDGSLRWSPMAVRAWMLPAKADAARAIPEDAAKLIAKESKGEVPATDDSWPSGISRPRRRPA